MSRLLPRTASPTRLAFLYALVMAAVAGLCALMLYHSWQDAVVLATVIFLLGFGLHRYAIRHFVQDQLKLIYKLIYQTKATKREEFFNQHILPQKSIRDVSKDVQAWAVRHTEEVSALRANESFRKEFLANLAHELRTPVFNIQGYVDTLLGGALEDPTVNRRFLANASRSTDRLVHLLNDLDEITNLETGTLRLTKTDFPVDDLVDEVFDELSLRADERRITLGFKRGAERRMSAHADKEKIRQVLVNLAENAIKYGHEGGNVTVGMYTVAGGHLYIEVSDDGPGIAEPHLPRLFERFYRADRSRNRAIGGTGLGLAIVKHIVEAHGHTATVRSTVGVGSSFGFTLDQA